MKRIPHILLLSLLLIAGSACAQTNMLGLQNVPGNTQFDWKQVATTSFDVHYYSDDPVMAGMAGKMAEEALWDICKALDYKNKTRFAIYLFVSPNDLVHSNSYPVANPKDNGITPLQIGSENVLFPGSYHGLREQVRAAVAKLLMEDYYFGGPIQFSLQNTLLLYLPAWYEDGLPAYIGEGWDYEDELWLAGLDKSDMLGFALEGDGPIYRTARKSIWHFISENYGREKLGEIFYMTRLTRSVEDGVIHVLGVTLKTLTDQWREFVVQRIRDNASFREPIANARLVSGMDRQGTLRSFAINPAKPWLAAYTEKGGKYRVHLHHLSDGRVRETAIEGGFATEQYATLPIEFPMAWSPDGKQLVTTVFDKGGEYLAWYDMDRGSTKFVRFQPGVERIYQIAWSPDGTQLVCSALRQGQIDLFRFMPGSGSFVQLTNDFEDDLYPLWNQEGTRIYHASTRTQATPSPDSPVRYDVNESGFDIWALDVGTDELSQVTRSPEINEYPIGMVSSFELLALTDHTGIPNLMKFNAFMSDSTHQTNLPGGIYRAMTTDSLVAFSTTSMGELQVFVADRGTTLHDQVATRCILRQQKDKAAAMARQKKDAAMRLDSLLRANAMAKDTVRDSEGQDSVNGDKPVKYYVFDDDERPQPRRRNKKPGADYQLKKEPDRPDFDGVAVGSPRRIGAVWAADRVTARFGFDPLFKLSVLGEARIRDQQGDQQFTVGFRPYIDFKSSDTYLRYANMKHAIDWQVGINRSGRFLLKHGLGARYTSTSLDLTGVLPLTRFLSVGAGANLAFLQRKNIELLVPKTIDGNALLAGAKVNLTYDKTDHLGNFIRRGSFASVDLGGAYSLTNPDDHFATAKMDLRQYLPVKRFVLATRLSGAWSAGPMAQRFFLGGTNDWLLSRWNNPGDYPIEDSHLPALHYMEYVTPIRGFQFNGRNGSKYVAANAELRLPVSRMFSKFLNTNPAYNIEVIPFFDIGSTWSQGNPLSQKNPIDTETINSYPLTITVQTLKSPFLMGFGAGTRLQLFGYSMRFDLAWGVDDYTILSPRLHASLGKNF